MNKSLTTFKFVFVNNAITKYVIYKKLKEGKIVQERAKINTNIIDLVKWRSTTKLGGTESTLSPRKCRASTRKIQNLCEMVLLIDSATRENMNSTSSKIRKILRKNFAPYYVSPKYT